MLRRSVSLLKSPRNTGGDAFDVIVVGCGVAGAMAASQCADANLKTLVIDQGDDILQKPLWHRTYGCSKYLHRMLQHGYETFHTTAQPVMWNEKEVSAPVIPSPCVVGGGNVMGGRSWILGDASDWDGSPWSLRNDIMPRIQRIESAALLKPHRGKNGRVQVGRAVAVSPFYKPFSEAWNKDCPLTSSFNKGEAKIIPSVGRPEVAIHSHTYRAHSTLNDYLEQSTMLKRPLSILANTKVLSITRGSSGADVAGGVLVTMKDGSSKLLEADQIVLAAGTIGSARALLASETVFPHLSTSTVGQGFWDVPSVVLQYRTKTPHLSHNVYYNKLVQLATFLGERLLGQTPDLASGYDDMICFWSSTGSPDVPDVKISIQPFTMNLDGKRPEGVDHGFQLVVQLVRPTSRGRITATAIEPNYLQTAEDRAALGKAVQRAKELCSAAPLSFLVSDLVSETFQSTGINGGSLAAGRSVSDQFKVDGFANVFAIGDAIIPKPTLGDMRPSVMALTDKFSDRLLNKKDVVAKINPFDGTKDEGATVRIIY